MPESPLMTAGAQIQPSAAAPLHTNEFFTGLWTQGNPLGPGAVPYLYQHFYAASRYDRLIGGLNAEITSRLTLGRRPGSSVYNSQLFPPINRFYEFRAFGPAGEVIHLMASVDPATGSTQGTVRDVTGPSTNLILQTKDPAAGRTSFVGVGNQLFWGDGVETGKWTTSKQAWQANTAYSQGQFIIDSNNNIQEAVGAQIANMANIEIDSISAPPGGYNKLIKLFFSPLTPLNISNNVSLTCAGFTTVPSLNGAGLIVQVESPLQTQTISRTVMGNPPATVYSVETGTVTTGNGVTGATPPVFATTPGAVTQDGGQQWVNKGSAVTGWGIQGPTNQPTVTQTAAPSIYPNWAANTWYAPLFVIQDSNGNLEKLITSGGLGNSQPSWSTVLGGITTESGGSGGPPWAQWQNMGPGTWTASTAVTVGQLVVATYTYYVTVPQTTLVWNGYTYQPQTVYQQVAVTVTSLFQCSQAGTTGANQPAWVNGLNTTTQDGTAAWTNLGTPSTWATIGATSKVSTASTILDSNYNQEHIQALGKSGAAAPTWQTTLGAITVDNTANWSNKGGASAGSATLPWIYGYSYGNSATGHISNMSPPSQPIVVTPGNVPVVQGVGSGDPQVDEIVIWRTKAGGSSFFEVATIPNPGAGQTWVYTDTVPDTAITGVTLIAPQLGGGPGTNFSDNSVPPPAFIPSCYYLNRIWGFVGNKLVYTNGPDTTTGSGNESMSPDNVFELPSTGVACWPTSIGLIVFTMSDTWVLLGQGTYDAAGNPISPFYLVNFQAGVGIMSQDAFTVNGSTAYVMLTSNQVVSMDPGAGETEVGFPIGDIFDDYYDPATVYLAWHQGKSRDMALYVADGTQQWYRMAATAAPESGLVWSLPAVIAAPGKVKAIASIETSPGKKALVIGPSVTNNPILKRDLSTNADNGATYLANAYIASVVLAQPGMTAGVQFVVTEEKMIAGATPLTVALLFDEILSTQTPSSSFLSLRKKSNDPPNLPPSKSIRTQRHWAAQDANSVIKCRHYQQAILWAAENYPNEIFTNTVYGRLPEKARK